jgi:Na+-driven multidrug efflux pump
MQHFLSVSTLWKPFLLFLVPLLITNILQSLSGTINTIFVGQLLGVNAVAAVAVFFPILFFLLSFVIGLAAGASVLIGQAWGAHELEKVKQITGNTLALVMSLGVVIAIIGVSFTTQALNLLGVPPEIELVTICRAVGKPRRKISLVTGPSKRTCAISRASGASGCCLCRV